MQKTYYVYIMAGHTKVLTTNDVETRAAQHQSAPPTTFTCRYNVHRLVHYEDYPDVMASIAREKQIKGWLRSKKIALIEAANPRWVDLSYRWRTSADSEESGDSSLRSE